MLHIKSVQDYNQTNLTIQNIHKTHGTVSVWEFQMKHIIKVPPCTAYLKIIEHQPCARVACV